MIGCVIILRDFFLPQRNFDAFRARHVENLRSQLAAIDKVIKDERREAENIQKEEEQNADWMWDVQRNYAEMEKQMAELDSQRVQLKDKAVALEEDHKVAQYKLEKEEAYVQKLHLNGKVRDGAPTGFAVKSVSY